MAAELTHHTTANTTGVVSIAFGAAPVGGVNAVAALDTATACDVKLLGRVHASSDWILIDRLVLAAGADEELNIAVYPSYAGVQWDVVSITGGAVKLSAIGVGV